MIHECLQIDEISSQRLLHTHTPVALKSHFIKFTLNYLKIYCIRTVLESV